MHASTTGMETTRTVLLVLGVLCLTCLASGLSETKADQSGNFSVEDYGDWLENHTINVVNYVAEVGTDVAILSPITPPPIGMRWFSLNFDGELRRPVGREVGRVGSTNSEKFLETYNTSWQSVFTFHKLNRWLRIRKVQLGYADLFRVFVGENTTGETVEKSSADGQTFDVAITLMTFEKHECGFTSKLQNPKAGDTLILSCSIIVNGMWNASLIFRNDYDESEIIGETKTCGIQQSLGSKICSSVRVKAETDILAYSCLLEFPSDGKHVPKHPMFQNSKWTADFNKKLACNLPKIYLGGHDEGDAMETAVTDAEAIAAQGQVVFPAGYGADPSELFCGHQFCGSFIGVPQQIHVACHGDDVDGKYKKCNCRLWIDDIETSCVFWWRVKDIGVKVVRVETDDTSSIWGKDSLKKTFTVIAEVFGTAEILCNLWPCLHNGIMKVGDNITLYFDSREAKHGYEWSVNLQHVQSAVDNRLDLWKYTLGVYDLGLMKIILKIDFGSTHHTLDRSFQVADELTGIDILCKGRACINNQLLTMGDEISCYFKPKFMFNGMTFTLLIDNYVKVEAYPCTYVLADEDVGRKLIKCNSNGVHGTFQIARNITVSCGVHGKVVLKPAKKGVIILCGDEPCNKPGRTIYTGTYVSCRTNGGQRTALKFTINEKLISWKMPAVLSEIYYKLRNADIGSVKAICSANGTDDVPVDFTVVWWPCSNLQARANLFRQPIGIDVMCNDKVCQDNEVMRFGDKISCYFEPKLMIDGVTFTLLIDNYTKVEGYPCTYALREEDVGSKSVKCNSQDIAQLFENTRNITVICEFRDEIVWKPVKKIGEGTPYELKFSKNNTTYKSGIFILCGDEPCDKPGRTIYTGTYVTCRMNDGQRATFNFKVNQKFISAKMPVALVEISYKLKDRDIGASQAKCSANGTYISFTGYEQVNFTVLKWPCPANVKPASADMFEYGNAPDEIDSDGSTQSADHGDAAGVIDLDQAENTDSGPAADNKGVPKWNDEMAAEKSGTAENDKPKPSIGSGRESFVLLQLFLAFIAAFVGLGQF